MIFSVVTLVLAKHQPMSDLPALPKDGCRLLNSGLSADTQPWQMKKVAACHHELLSLPTRCTAHWPPSSLQSRNMAFPVFIDFALSVFVALVFYFAVF